MHAHMRAHTRARTLVAIVRIALRTWMHAHGGMPGARRRPMPGGPLQQLRPAKLSSRAVSLSASDRRFSTVLCYNAPSASVFDDMYSAAVYAY